MSAQKECQSGIEVPDLALFDKLVDCIHTITYYYSYASYCLLCIRLLTAPTTPTAHVFPGAAGSVAVRVWAPHWLHNASSVPVRVHAASLSRGLAHVVEALERSASDLPFSLADQVSSVQLAAAGASRGQGLTSKWMGELGKNVSTGFGLAGSKSFSIMAVGNSGSVDLICPDGTIAELAVLTTTPPAGYEECDFTVVEVHDMYELRNSTGSDIEFRQAVCQPSGHVEGDAGAERGRGLRDPGRVTLVQKVAPGGVAVLRWGRCLLLLLTTQYSPLTTHH